MDQHQPITIENMKGLWNRDNFVGKGSVPQDHFSIAQNIDFSNSNVIARAPFTVLYDDLSVDKPPVRMFSARFVNRNGDPCNFLFINTQDGHLFSYNYDTGVTDEYLLSFSSETDFDYQLWNNRLYISPSSQQGYHISGVPLQVFDGVTMRDAAGGASASTFTNAASGAGIVQAGNHFYGVCFETDTGYITPPTISTSSSTPVATSGSQAVSLTSIPTGGPEVVARWIVATKTIPSVIPNSFLYSYQIFFLQRIGDNVTTSATLNYYDSQLLNDASYLLDLYATPYGGTSLCTYHNRLVMTCDINSLDNAVVSRFGNPESFDLVEGVISLISPPTLVSDDFETVNTGLVDSQVYRDVLYLTKPTSTYSTTDNGQEPAFWPAAVVDSSLGSYRHGIANTATGGESVDYLLIANPSGLYLFTGYFNRPEISWKIEDTWRSFLDYNSPFRYFTILNDSYNKKIYCFGNNSISIFDFVVCDYQDVPTDFSGYRDLVRWSTWDAHGAGVSDNSTLAAMCLDFGSSGCSLLARSEHAISEVMVLGGNGTAETNIETIIKTGEFRSPDERMIHINKVRMRAGNNISATSVETSSIKAYGTSDEPIATLPNLVFNNNATSNNSTIEPTLLTNLTAQRISFEIKLTDAYGFILQKLVPFIKATYASLPGQYIK